jgi:DNA-binding XRE family transcriptional regulator
MVSLMEETPKDSGTPRVTRRGTPPRQNGPAIEAIRLKDGWTQTGLAKAAGIRQASLSAIETELSNASVLTLNKLARCLRVPVAAIMRDWSDQGAAGPRAEPVDAAA